MRKISFIAAVLLAAASVRVSAGNTVISEAGLSLPDINIQAPQTKAAAAQGETRVNQWMTLRKIKVNEAAPEMNDTLVGIVQRGFNIDQAVKELNKNGFKASALQDNNGGYMVMVDVSGLDAADYAVVLARYYYITEVQVGKKVFGQLFDPPSSRSVSRNNMWLTLRKIKVNEAQQDMNDTLVGIVQRGFNIDQAVKELNENGFKASVMQDNNGGYMVMVDVSGLDAADYAIGLARYYYINEVQVGKKVFDRIFPDNK